MPGPSQSDIWNKIYGNQEQISTWPWTDLVQLIMRHARPQKQGFKVLELGCGAGANIPFFVSLKADYYSVESSEIIVARLHKAFPQFRDSIVVGDFTKELPNKNFDLIVDRGSLSCNNTESIEQCIQRCHEQLKFGGKFVGVDWYSTKCSLFNQGQVEDEWTRINLTNSAFASPFRLHFSDKEHLLGLLSKFHIEVLEHKTIESELNEEHPIFASWNFVVAKS